MNPGSMNASQAWLATAANRLLVAGGLRGLEKECLRVGRDGRLSSAPHSERFGSALTHPWLTTDYSEALLEFVTPPFTDNAAALGFLSDLHAFVVRADPEDLLWPASMPCIIESDDAVPIACYGTSNEGRMRSVYRSGLGYRYGRAMQAIAGTHFNFSMPPDFWPAWKEHRRSADAASVFKSEALLGLARNFRRCGWLLTYLYGASPAFSRSFRPAGHAELTLLDPDTWHAPFSTSLRMSDLGYRNTTQARLAVSLNSLDEYIAELARALTTRDERYAAIGVEVDGEYRQLNANILQLENEYYSAVRPKPAAKTPRLIEALATTGVEYVEIRTLDLNPFSPLGMTAEQAALIELLLIWCLLSDSPPISPAELDEIDHRDLRVAWFGRRPGLELPRDGRAVPLASWAEEILAALDGLAAAIATDDTAARAVGQAREAVRDAGGTLSARVLDGMRASGESFFRWAMQRAEAHHAHFLNCEFARQRQVELESVAAASLAEAAASEAAAEMPFAEHLERFMAAARAVAESTSS